MLKSGMVIGNRYEIIELVGSGGMSDVYKAQCHKLNRKVAIKVLKKEFSDDTNFVAKFRVEAQSAAGLSHPNIVNVYDVGEDEGIHYIVMELVEGITLKKYIQEKGRLPIEQAIDFATQIASGIEVAHMNHTIHRDIKPQNIIVSNNGLLKVTDFGIARAATSNTVASNAMGSVHYISPEQARGGYSDEKSDIYSLGITLYEMVTGRVPFEGENNVTVALMHIQGQMIPPREYYPDIPVSVEKIIQKATQKKPELRYLTANAMIADLKRALAEPDGEYVHLTPVVTDSPTVNISEEEVSKIKKQAVPKQVVTTEEKAKPEKKPEKNMDLYENNEEEELAEEEEIDPKLQKLIVILGIVTAVILAMFLLFMVGKGLKLFSFGGNKDNTAISTDSKGSVVMKNVVGKKIEDAKAEIEALGGDIVVKTEYKPSDTIEADYVMEQDVKEGETLSPGSVVVLTVSSGTNQVEVIDVTKLTKGEAETKLKSAGFDVKFEYIYSDTVEKDKVVKQDPEGGSKVPEGTTITLYISEGKEVKEAIVPELKNMTLSEVQIILKENNLKLGSVTKEYHDTVPSGLVISQDYKKGDKVPEGTAINITISLGPKSTNVVYKGSITISSCPFEGDEGADIRLVLVQDGNKTTIFDDTLFPSDFPKTFTFEGKKGSAEVYLYVNGVEQSQRWNTTLVAVSE